MTLYLFVTWSVVVALALPALLTQLARPSTSHADELLTIRNYSPAVVAAVVAVVLTVARVQVSDDDMYDATVLAVAQFDASPSIDADALRLVVEEHLGHSVVVDDLGDDDEDSNPGVVTLSHFEVATSKGSETAACVEVRTYVASPAYLLTDVTHGRCR